MMFHGQPLIKCSSPSCRKCHCNECEFARQTSIRVVAYNEEDRTVFFMWMILAQQARLVIKLGVE